MVIFDATKSNFYHGIEKVQQGERKVTRRIAISIGCVAEEKGGYKYEHGLDYTFGSKEDMDKAVNEVIAEIAAEEEEVSGQGFCRRVLEEVGQGRICCRPGLANEVLRAKKEP